jgi:hypothetical protein
MFRLPTTFDNLPEDKKWIYKNWKLSIANDTVMSIIHSAMQTDMIGHMTWDDFIDFKSLWTNKEDCHKYLNKLADEIDKITWNVELVRFLEENISTIEKIGIMQYKMNKQKRNHPVYTRFFPNPLEKLAEDWQAEIIIKKGILDEKISEIKEKLNWEEASIENPQITLTCIDFLIDIIQLKSKYEIKDWTETVSIALNYKVDSIKNLLLPPRYFGQYPGYENGKKVEWKIDENTDIHEAFIHLLYNADEKFSSQNLQKFYELRKYFQSKIDEDKIKNIKKEI